MSEGPPCPTNDTAGRRCLEWPPLYGHCPAHSVFAHSEPSMALAAPSRPPQVDATIAELKAMLGDRLSTAHAVREQHGKDISYHEAHLPDAVVFAESSEEVQTIVQ